MDTRPVPTFDGPESFWKEFAARYWKQRPLSLPDSPVALEIPEDELLRAVTLAADKSNRPKGSDLPTVVVSVDKRTQPTDTRDFLPLPDDTSLDAYLARVDHAWRDHDWSVAVSGLHAVSAPLWDRAKRLADDLYKHTGSSVAARVDVDTFVGRYASTNVGVHVDHADNFGFTLRGRKELLTWPPSRAEHVPQHTAHYAAARGSADVLLGVPGALTYFPSPQLHVGESPDAVSVNVNIAFFHRRDPAGTVGRAVSRLLARATASSGTASSGPAGSPDDVPADVAPFLDAMARLSRQETEDAVWEERARASTSGGLGVGRPAQAPTQLTGVTDIALCDGVTLRHRLFSDGRRGVAAQGHILRIADNARVVAAVEKLAEGESVDLARWEERAESADVPLMQAVLLRLSTWQALRFGTGGSGMPAAQHAETTA